MNSLNFECHELANNLVKERAEMLNDKKNYNQKVKLDDIWDGIEIGIKTAADSLENFAKEIPGLNDIVYTVDFRVIIENRLLDYLIVRSFFCFSIEI
jgi:hypothetical protein